MLLIYDRGGISQKNIFLEAVRLNMVLYEDVPKTVDNFKVFINGLVDIIKKNPPDKML